MMLHYYSAATAEWYYTHKGNQPEQGFNYVSGRTGRGNPLTWIQFDQKGKGLFTVDNLTDFVYISFGDLLAEVTVQNTTRDGMFYLSQYRRIDRVYRVDWQKIISFGIERLHDGGLSYLDGMLDRYGISKNDWQNPKLPRDFELESMLKESLTLIDER